MSHYYQTPAGQVFDTLIPSSVRSNAGTREKTYFHPRMESLDDATINRLPKKQQAVIRHLITAGQPLTAVELMAKAACTQDPIRRLQKKGLLKPEVRREMTTSNPTRWQVSDGETERS